MSQDYHNPGVFDRYKRSSTSNPASASPGTDQRHVAQQIRRDKLRVTGCEFDPTMDGMEEHGGIQGYETSGMLTERFNFGTAPAATEVLEQQYIAAGFRTHRGLTDDWYGLKDHQRRGTSVNINTANSAFATPLLLTNPQARSPSASPRPPPHHQTTNFASSTLHALLPNSSNSLQGFNASTAAIGSGIIIPSPSPPEFTRGHDDRGQGVNPNPSDIPGVAVEGQGLSLSLSSSLQHLEATKAEEFRHNLLFFNNQLPGGGGNDGASAMTTNHQYPYKNISPAMHFQSGMSFSGDGVVNILRNSKYLRAAQELLEEFCSVGRVQFRKSKQLNHPGTSTGNNGVGYGGGSSSSSKEAAAPPLSSSDRMEHQRRKLKLLSMIDEVDRRYNRYCEQMQMVVNSFDLVMGFGSAIPYTVLAQKAMSRHFRCMKDAITAQLKHSCELLGEKDGTGNSGLTRGETPRLKLLDQSLRQQRAYHQMGMMEQEAWRPQRGLPERSVNILRAWLFEHFLHPYPSDADKLLLARQAGLSRNQVSNWFINARVRLWKPMVEEMYQREGKDEEEEDDDADINTPMVDVGSDGDLSSIHPAALSRANFGDEACREKNYGTTVNACTVSNVSSNPDAIGSTLLRFGTTAGDVSLSLGLRHAGNMPEKSLFSVTDFGSC